MISSIAQDEPGPNAENPKSPLQSGDTLVVWKLDRLGRTVKGLVDLVQTLQDGVEQAVLSPAAISLSEKVLH